MAFSERLKKFDLFPDGGTELGEYVSPELSALCSELTLALSKKIASIPIWFDYSPEEQKDLILNFLNTKLNEQFSEIKLTNKEKERITNMFFNSVYGFGSLDFLISQKYVSKIIVNSPYEIYTESNGELTRSDVQIDNKQYESLIKRLMDISAKTSSVITFRLNNLLVTILREPVCTTKLILKKVVDTNFNFEYFLRRDILNDSIVEFLRKFIKDRANVIISAPVQCGKTSFLNAFIQDTEDTDRSLLFEEGALINTNKSGVLRFDTENLSPKEQLDLITATLYYQPDYIFSDINNIGFNIELSDLQSPKSGFISTVRANSPSEVVNFYSNQLVSRQKCSEKLARIQFAKDFDYIIQLDKASEFFTIKSIVQVETNKSGSPVLKEIVVFNSGEYNFNFKKYNNKNPDVDIKSKDQEEIIPKGKEAQPRITFTRRMNLK